MKNLLLLLFLFLFSTIEASSFFVFKKVGDVRVVRDNKTILVKEKMILQDKDIIYIGNNSSLTLTNSKKKNVIIIKKSCQGKIKSLIKRESPGVDILKPFRSFFNYIDNLCSTDFVNENNEVLRGVSERGDSEKTQEEENNLKLVLEIIERSKP
jgi:hypothetical protein